jgi:hypothetical protein
LVDVLTFAADIITIGGGLIFGVKCFSLSRSLERYYSRNFLVIGVAAVVFVWAELVHLATELGYTESGEPFHQIIEAFFIVLLAIGVFRFYPSWMPKGSATSTTTNTLPI